MRPLGILLSLPLLFSAFSAVQADDQRTMVERFTAPPNYNLSYTDPSIHSSNTDKKSPVNTGNNNLKTFNLFQIFHSKDKGFQTNQYNTSNFWAGNFKFNTSDANLKTGTTLASIIRLFKTGSAETRTASESGDTFQTRDDLLTSEKNNAVFRGKLQKRLNKEGDKVLQGDNPIQGGGAMHVMTIDEVRELLNKPK